MFNQVILIGNLGADPELRYTPQGTPVANFNLAVNKTWTNNQGERQEKTVWLRVTVWRKQAETCAQFLKKGRRVLVVGEVEEANAWTDRDGHPRATLEVTAQFVKFLDSGGDNAHGDGDVDVPDLESTADIPF